MPAVEYLLYDVFTDVPFAGNPLAVAIDPPPLTTEQCATVARELNLSETVFLRTGGVDGADVAAAAASVGYLAATATEGRLQEGWLLTQGVEVGRPSEIHVGAVRRGGELVAATVGGRAVRVGHGRLDL